MLAIVPRNPFKNPRNRVHVRTELIDGRMHVVIRFATPLLVDREKALLKLDKDWLFKQLRRNHFDVSAYSQDLEQKTRAFLEIRRNLR